MAGLHLRVTLTRSRSNASLSSDPYRILLGAALVERGTMKLPRSNGGGVANLGRNAML